MPHPTHRSSGLGGRDGPAVRLIGAVLLFGCGSATGPGLLLGALELEGEAERRGPRLELEDESGPVPLEIAGTIEPGGGILLILPGGARLESVPRLEG